MKGFSNKLKGTKYFTRFRKFSSIQQEHSMSSSSSNEQRIQAVTPVNGVSLNLQMPIPVAARSKA